MFSEAQLKQFEVDGFIKGDIVLNDDEVEKLREELDAVMEGKSVKPPVLNRNLLANKDGHGMKMSKIGTVVQIVNIWMASDAFLEHARNAKICEDVAQLCGTDTLRVWHDQVQYKPPIDGGPTRWHQDHPLWPIIQPADLVSAWVALDDAMIDNGCMWMVPGSHKWGNHIKQLTDTEDFMPLHKDPSLLPEGAEVKAVPFEIKKGQVGYHHCMTWHGALPNRSERKRRAIAVHYMPNHIRYEPVGNHVMNKFITVKPGELLIGDEFPVVYSR